MRSVVKTGHRVRALGAGLVLAACAVLTTGCSAESVAETVSEAVATPQQKLVAAAPTTSTAPFNYAITQKGSPEDATDTHGAVNAPAKSYELTDVERNDELGYTLTTAFRVVDKKSWLKMKFAGGENLDLPEIPDKWMTIDPAKLKTKGVPTTFTDQDEDPARLGALFTSIVDATEGAGGAFTGTIDYTKQPNVDIVSAETVQALGEKAKSLPFTAKITDGKVTEFALSVPAAGKFKAQTYTVTYGEYGSAAPVTAPSAAESIAMPASVVQLLNS